MREVLPVRNASNLLFFYVAKSYFLHVIWSSIFSLLFVKHIFFSNLTIFILFLYLTNTFVLINICSKLKTHARLLLNSCVRRHYSCVLFLLGKNNSFPELFKVYVCFFFCYDQNYWVVLKSFLNSQPFKKCTTNI